MKKFLVSILALLIIFSMSAVMARALFDTPYIGNKYRMTFHRRDCPSVDQMWEENQVPLETLEEADRKGFRPCKNCRPDLKR